MDNSSPDHGATTTVPKDYNSPVHNTLLSHGVLIAEHMTNMTVLAGRRIEVDGPRSRTWPARTARRPGSWHGPGLSEIAIAVDCGRAPEGGLKFPAKRQCGDSDRARRSLAPAGASTMFIQTEATPNPATLKFLPGRTVLADGTLEFRDRRRGRPVAAGGAAVRRSTASPASSSAPTSSPSPRPDGEWQQLKPAILGAIMEHFCPARRSWRPEPPRTTSDEFFEAKDTEIVATIKELIETRVRPAVAKDGGDITFRGFRDGVVYLDMHGSCSGCPSSTATLRHGIENLLRHYRARHRRSPAELGFRWIWSWRAMPRPIVMAVATAM